MNAKTGASALGYQSDFIGVSNESHHSQSPSLPSSPEIPAGGVKSVSRRQFFKQLAACAALPLVGGIYANRIEPFWPRYFEVPIQIKGLPKSFQNFRIAQVTDMHTGRVPTSYLQKVMQQVNDLKPDLVVFTGDLVHHNSGFVDAVAQLLKTVSAPTITSFGNHDFAPPRGDEDPGDPLLQDKLETAIRDVGGTVLRNASMPIERADGRIWFVGLDDLWFGEFDPIKAFKDVPAGEPVIALSHNPDTAELLDPRHPDVILSGHTHGGQIRLPFYGAMRLNVKHPEYDMGHYQLPNSQLFVSTGVGYIIKVRFNCRPEVPVFVLKT